MSEAGRTKTGSARSQIANPNKRKHLDRQTVLNMLQMSTLCDLISCYEDPSLSREEVQMVEAALAVSFEDLIANVPCGEA